MESDYSGYFTPKNIIGLVCGPLLLAVGINLFVAPHHLAFGGVTGLTIIIQSLTGIPLSISNLALSVLVMLIGWRCLGFEFFIKTIIPTLATPLWLWLTGGLSAIIPHIAVSIICGALTMGVGVGLVMSVGGSTAGTDTVALALHKKFKTPIPPMMKIIDISVILCGFYVYGWQTALFSVGVAIAMSEAVKRTMKLMKKWDDSHKQ
jgi:uncharacterized membrane-anchored protein YitT (DUF2179 family)